MIKLEEHKLRSFLLNRKEKIGIKKYSGVGEIISGLSLIVTILCSDFKKILFIKALYFEIVSWIIAIIVLGVGIIIFVSSICNTYTTEDLYNELMELDEDKINAYNIILLKNNQADGKYLLFYSQRWKCNLFLNYKALNSNNYNIKDEIDNIAKLFSNDTGISCNISDIEYLDKLDSKKFSFGDKVEKQYIFYFYTINIQVSANMQNLKFCCNGNKYCWMTLNEMYKNKNIIKKNADVLDFIRKKSSLA